MGTNTQLTTTPTDSAYGRLGYLRRFFPPRSSLWAMVAARGSTQSLCSLPVRISKAAMEGLPALMDDGVSGKFCAVEGGNTFSALQPYLAILAQLTRQRKWVVFVAPPFDVPIPMLMQAGFNTARFMVVNAKSAEGRSWALMQAVEGRHCGAVLYWGELTETCRLQVERAVQETQSVCLWFEKDEASTAHLGPMCLPRQSAMPTQALRGATAIPVAA